MSDEEETHATRKTPYVQLMDSELAVQVEEPAPLTIQSIAEQPVGTSLYERKQPMGNIAENEPVQVQTTGARAELELTVQVEEPAPLPIQTKASPNTKTAGSPGTSSFQRIRSRAHRTVSPKRFNPRASDWDSFRNRSRSLTPNSSAEPSHANHRTVVSMMDDKLLAAVFTDKPVLDGIQSSKISSRSPGRTSPTSIRPFPTTAHTSSILQEKLELANRRYRSLSPMPTASNNTSTRGRSPTLRRGTSSRRLSPETPPPTKLDEKKSLADRSYRSHSPKRSPISTLSKQQGLSTRGRSPTLRRGTSSRRLSPDGPSSSKRGPESILEEKAIIANRGHRSTSRNKRSNSRRHSPVARPGTSSRRFSPDGGTRHTESLLEQKQTIANRGHRSLSPNAVFPKKSRSPSPAVRMLGASLNSALNAFQRPTRQIQDTNAQDIQENHKERSQVVPGAQRFRGLDNAPRGDSSWSLTKSERSDWMKLVALTEDNPAQNTGPQHGEPNSVEDVSAGRGSPHRQPTQRQNSPNDASPTQQRLEEKISLQQLQNSSSDPASLSPADTNGSFSFILNEEEQQEETKEEIRPGAVRVRGFEHRNSGEQHRSRSGWSLSGSEQLDLAMMFNSEDFPPNSSENDTGTDTLDVIRDVEEEGRGGLTGNGGSSCSSISSVLIADVTHAKEAVDRKEKPDRRRTLWFWVVAVIVLLVVGVSLGVVLSKSDSSALQASPSPSPATPVPTQDQIFTVTPTQSATRSERFVQLLEILVDVSGEEAFADGTSAQSRTLVWLADEDVYVIEDISLLKQRYIVALLYFATSEGTNAWMEQYGFLSSTDVCTWSSSGVGVFCDINNEVTDVVLSANRLEGSIPQELFLLPALTRVDLGNNVGLAGLLPPSMGNSTNLTSLLLGGCSFIGSIPVSIENLVGLRVLDVSANNLSGSIPPAIGSLPVLEELRLNANTLTGGIPSFDSNADALAVLHLEDNELSGDLEAFVSSTANATSLRELFLSGNVLSGTLPTLLGSLSSLTVLSLGDGSFNNRDFIANGFSGGIPSELGYLTNLVTLALRGFPSLSSRIPSELGLLLGLHRLSLGSNFLFGSIPWELGNLVNLEWLDVDNNQLSGEIPSELGNLVKLEAGFLDWNRLEGEVPFSLHGLESLEFLTLRSNSLTGDLDPIFCTRANPLQTLTADCLEPTPEIVCHCCTLCCRDVDICRDN